MNVCPCVSGAFIGSAQLCWSRIAVLSIRLPVSGRVTLVFRNSWVVRKLEGAAAAVAFVCECSSVSLFP